MAKPDGIRAIGGKKKAKIMIYGIAGAGKTRLIGTTPGRNLILRPPTDHTTSIDKPVGTFEEWQINDWSTMDEVLEFCRHEGSKHYDWIWIDSLSNLQDSLLDDVWQDTIARKPERATFGLDKGEYGINMGRLGTWCRDMVGMDTMNIGFTGHPFQTTVGGGEDYGSVEEGDPILMPWVQGRNMSPKICGYMNGVFYLRVVERAKKPVRELLVDILPRERGAAIYGKNQLFTADKSPIANPTMTALLDRINGGGRTRLTRPTGLARRRTTIKRKA